MTTAPWFGHSDVVFGLVISCTEKYAERKHYRNRDGTTKRKGKGVVPHTLVRFRVKPIKISPR